MTNTENLHPDLLKVRTELIEMLETDDEIARVTASGQRITATPKKGDEACCFRFEIGACYRDIWSRSDRPERPEQIVMKACGTNASIFKDKVRTFKRRKDGTFNWPLIADRIDEHLTEFVTMSAKREARSKEAQEQQRAHDAVQAELLDRGILKADKDCGRDFVSSRFTMTTDEGEKIEGILRPDGKIDLQAKGLDMVDALRLLDNMGVH